MIQALSAPGSYPSAIWVSPYVDFILPVPGFWRE